MSAARRAQPSVHGPGPWWSWAAALSIAALSSCDGGGAEPQRGTSAEALQAPPPSLTGSSFEIETNANLKLDNVGTLDWASVAEIRQLDRPTGQGDDSYSGGAKEDDACPSVGTGSIPNNKSDLKVFGVYKEPGTLAKPLGFLHLYWNRVQEPSGTTLMDFEFNQSQTTCANGINKVRTPGDMLIEYLIEQGGATATVTLRKWTGAAWGPASNLGTGAAGTINSTAIAAGDADGLGAISARTFGEASIDLSTVFPANQCQSFGSAMLKSRSSSTFDSALKDFVAPVGITLTNCGTVKIRKQTDPDGAAGLFGFSDTIPAPATPTFSLADNGVQTFVNIPFGTGYTVSEDALAGGFQLRDIDCSASSFVSPTINGRTVTFDLDTADDVLDCTYTNQARGGIVIEKVTTFGAGAFAFTSGSLPGGAFTLTTTGPGAAGKASTSFAGLQPGVYDVAESVPAGWRLASATCSDGSAPGAIGLSAGETVTCTFTNAPLTGAIKIIKTRKHAADGPGPHPQAGVVFTVSGGSLAAPTQVTTGADGTACVSGVLLSSFVGDYSVTENVPFGYRPDGPVTKAVTVTQAAICGDGHEAVVAFGNTPLTNLSVTVDSQIDGGTASTIRCVASGGAVIGGGATGPSGDGVLSIADLAPDTYTCTIVIDP